MSILPPPPPPPPLGGPGNLQRGARGGNRGNFKGGEDIFKKNNDKNNTYSTESGSVLEGHGNLLQDD